MVILLKGWGFEMLKTNSKIAREGVRAWIRNCYSPEGYDEAPAQDGSIIEICRFIYSEFMYEYGNHHRGNLQELFIDWQRGLPTILDAGCFYGSISSVMVVGDILEETIAERERYTEEQASILLCKMIYIEIRRYC